MKKIICVFLILVFLLSFPLVAFAESSAPAEDRAITTIIVDYVKQHFEEITVIGALCVSLVWELRSKKKLNGSVGTLNNNAIAIAQKSSDTISRALERFETAIGRIGELEKKIDDFISEMKISFEEKARLEETVKSVEGLLKTEKLAALELANEVAELLVLANIPNSKKEELYARHTKAIEDLKAVEGVLEYGSKTD